MSQMREITTINQNSNSDASEKLTNGHSADNQSPSATNQYSLTSTIKSDGNNNNVMKKSMPPPVPPKKYNRNNGATKPNTDPADNDNSTQANNNSSSGTSHNAVINHVHGPIARGNELHKLSNSSNDGDDEQVNGNGKGQCGVSKRLDNVADCKNDRKTASVLCGGSTISSDNNKKLNDDIAASTATASKCDRNSGTSNHCDNALKSDKKDGALGGDMVDSGAGYCVQRPEEETVMLLKNDERRLPNSNKCNDKQTNDADDDDDGDRSVTFDKHRNNCDSLREINATNINEIVGVNNGGDSRHTNKNHGDDLFGDDLEEDPYAELQSYLEKVKREINEVLEQRKLSGAAASPSSLHDSNDIIRNKAANSIDYRSNGIDAALKHDSLREAHCRLNAKIIRNVNSLNAPLSPNHGSNIRKTNEWADSILKDLDTLILSNQRYTASLGNSITTSNPTSNVTAAEPPKSPHKRSTIINVVLRKTTPSTSPTSPTAPTAFASTPTNNLNKNQTAIINTAATTTKDNNKIPKPEKHTYIPLQSFKVERPKDLPLSTSSAKGNRKYAVDILEKYSKQPHFGLTASKETTNFPVLKIEEDFEDIPTNGTCKTISTQTSPVNELSTGGRTNKKGSSNSLWTSDESILRSGETGLDEDTKSSSSSSACEETGGVISSGKSDSSGLDNDNAESGIGTATPPKEQENWRQLKSAQQHNHHHHQQHHHQQQRARKNWVRQESVMTQTNYDDVIVALPLPPVSPLQKIRDCGDEMDNLDILSLCEGTTDEYDITEDDYLSDDRKLDKSIDTASSCTKSSSAERDYDSDVAILRNHTNRTSSACSLPQESATTRLHATSYPIHYSDKSLHAVKSECSGSSSSSAGSAKISNSSRSQLPPRRPFVLHLHNEPFHNVMELPSPSSASLHSGHGHLTTMQELTTKSNSAPILLKKERKRDDFVVGHPINLRYSRSQSDRYLAEIEAIEACKWLRAAGFPQYAQMYEDLQFPIDLSNVAKDHPFLENDPLQSLYRRLVALNRCATMRLDSAHKHGTNNKEESEDDEYALSENWTFQQTNRRWSRVGEMDMQKPIEKLNSTLNTSRESSPEQNDTNDEQQLGFSTLPIGVSFSQSQGDEQDQIPVRLRRTGSERLKDGAKAFLRRVESIKSRRRKRQNRDGVVISGPQTLDLSQISPKMNDLKMVNIITMSTPPSPAPGSPYTTILTNNKLAATLNNNELRVIANDYSSTEKLSPNHLSPRHYTNLAPNSYLHTQHSQSNRTSPLHFFAHNPGLTKDLKGSGDDSSSYCSDASQESSGGGGGGVGSGVSTIPKKRPSRTRRFLQKGSKVEDIGALSDSECHQMFSRQRNRIFHDGNQLTVNNNNNNSVDNTIDPKSSKFSRGGSLNLGKESQKFKESFKSRSFRSRSSARVKADGEFDNKFRTRSSVVRWHSFQNGERPEWCKITIKTPDFKQDAGTLLASMSCGQLQVVRKLALVTLTGYMERYCPTHRSGWNWELPKFIKKIKTPDYKDKRVFGVPLVLFLQRTGQTMPTAIQTAFKWLKLNALDQVGLFRKSGVKSRIAKLKELIEDSHGDVMETYDLQQAYDVADMLKQYFRELPDTLLTAKMSDTFIAIFQHLPAEVHFDAVQSAILLLPDEHREVLQYLLEFLHNVAGHAMINQMTSNNLAVCLAPSLFHGAFSAPPRSNSVSPRRRKPTGMPDSRELTETRASHDCLTYMIENYRKLFSISNEKVQRCNFNYMEESKPVPLEALGEGLQVHDWRGYLYECTSATIKEGREKSRGWISMQTFDPFIDVAHKKVGDGHPLRLWRCTTEIEATPMEILHFIFKERRQWDSYLMKCRIVEQLDDHSEIFQYATGGHVITDYCVLRSWRADLPRGACVVVETSVAHSDAHLLLGGVRGVVLASRYLIEPIGNGKSKIMHLARVDTKGRSPEWYNKCYGHICSQYLSKIRSAFKHHSIGSDGK